MKQNVGTIERAIRAIIGIAALVAAFTMLGALETTLGIVAIVVGVVMLGTAAIGWCPPYALLGISTCKAKTAE